MAAHYVMNPRPGLAQKVVDIKIHAECRGMLIARRQRMGYYKEEHDVHLRAILLNAVFVVLSLVAYIHHGV